MADITKEYLALRDQYIESRFARLNPVQRQAVFATETSGRPSAKIG